MQHCRQDKISSKPTEKASEEGPNELWGALTGMTKLPIGSCHARGQTELQVIVSDSNSYPMFWPTEQFKAHHYHEVISPCSTKNPMVNMAELTVVEYIFLPFINHSQPMRYKMEALIIFSLLVRAHLANSWEHHLVEQL